MPKRKNPEYSNKPDPKNEDKESKIIDNTEQSPEIVEKFEAEETSEESEKLKVDSKTSKVFKFIRKKILPAVVEGTNQAVGAFNHGVDYAAKALNHVIPDLSELAIDMVLPKNLARPVEKTIEYSTKATTFVTKTLLKTGLNVFTFGAPAWVDAFRQHLAVKDGNEKYEQVADSQDLLAVNYLDHLKDEKIKTALREYTEARKELLELRKNPEVNAEKIAEISEKIASYEVNYKDCTDFYNLKAILEKGKDFMDSNEALINELAMETANKMISNVENFYKEKFGKFAKSVKGKWLGIVTSPEKGREKLLAEITERLKLVMSKELNGEAVQMEMKRINNELFSKFGVYRKYLKAGIFALLRCVPIPETAGSGEAAKGVWAEISEALGRGFEAGKTGEVAEGTSSGIQEALKAVLSGTWEKFKDFDKLNFLPSAKEYVDFIKNLCDETVSNLMSVGAQNIGEGAGGVVKWVGDGVKFVGNHILEATGITAIVAKMSEITKRFEDFFGKLTEPVELPDILKDQRTEKQIKLDDEKAGALYETMRNSGSPLFN